MAAPIFKRIAEASLRHLGIAPTVNPPPPVLVAAQRAGRCRSRSTRARHSRRRSRSSSGSRRLMPDLRGLERARRAARADARRLDGAARRRRIRRRAVAGCRAPRRSRAVACTLKLGRQPPPRARRERPVTLGDSCERRRARAAVRRALPSQRGRQSRGVGTVASCDARLARGRAGLGLRRASRFNARTALRSPRDAIARGAIAVVAETPAPAGVTVPVDAGRRTRGWRSPRSPRRSSGTRAIGSSLVGDHRHERQDDDVVSAGVDLRSRRASSAAASAPVGYQHRPHRRDERDATRTTPEAPELQRMLRDMVDARLRRLRDGGLVARARAAARRPSCTSAPRSSRT